jgi:hypothetical protein
MNTVIAIALSVTMYVLYRTVHAHGRHRFDAGLRIGVLSAHFIHRYEDRVGPAKQHIKADMHLTAAQQIIDEFEAGVAWDAALSAPQSGRE